MAFSIITYEGDGVTTTYALNFALGILSRDDVTCRVNNEVDGLDDPVYRDLEWINDGLVTIQGDVPEDGDPIVFTRTVSKTALIHDYENGEVIEESNLDESNKQTLMAVHEMLDGRIPQFSTDLSMTGFRITDLADGIDDNDAVNLGQLNAHDEDIDAAVAAAQAAQAAAEVAQGVAEDKADLTAADVVLTHADVVLTHADVVLTHADAATTSSDRITVAADKATVAADKATVAADKATTLGYKNAADADVVLTNADVVLTHADVVLTHADVVLTHADVVTTGNDVTSANASAAAAAVSKTLAAAAAGFGYKFSTNTASSDPTSGFLKVNNATLASATALYISETTNDSQAIASILATFDDSTSTIKTRVRLFKQSDATVFAIFNITGTLTDNGTWDTFTIAYVGGSGSFSNNDVLTAQFLITGDKGDQGIQGIQGPSGSVPIAAAGGTVDAITADYTPDIALGNMQVCAVVSAGVNTVTNPAFTPDGLTTRTITSRGGAALIAGDTGAAGYVMLLEYNLANTRWELMNPNRVINADLAPMNANTVKANATASAAVPTDVALSTGTVLGRLAANIVEINLATAAQYFGNTADKIMKAETPWSAAGAVGLTDAATIALNLATGINFSVTLGGNRTLGAPSNVKDGQTGYIKFTQDGTGTRTLAFNAAWKNTAGIQLSTAAGTVDVLWYEIVGSTPVVTGLIKGI